MNFVKNQDQPPLTKGAGYLEYIMLKLKSIAVLNLVFIANYASATIFDVFKDEDGKTKWQHVANFSGSILILLLSLTLLSLLYSRFRLRQRNRELREIKRNLEETVRKRTENLNKSNRLLKESNELLEDEIKERKATAALLLSSQNYLQSILASMPSMLIGLNEGLEITHWNRTAESIAGIKAEDAIGGDLWSIYPTITLAREQAQRVLDTRQPLIIKHSQRAQYYFDITVYPLDGELLGIVVIVENVTQRSLAENMLIQRDKMASMGELASTMAHDINIPLRAILDDVREARAVLESSGMLTDHASAVLNNALERGHQASAVVDNLLDFASNNGAEKQEIHLPELINHCVDLAHNVLSDAAGLKFKDLEIQLKYEPELPLLPCYSAELQQVFLSLFRQACFAMGAKQRGCDAGFAPILHIDVHHAYDALWVKVHHNGDILSPAQQQELFEPFIQHTTPINPKPVILENRLSFSYFVVTEHHDGEMAVTSDAEAGTTFHLQFHLNGK